MVERCYPQCYHPLYLSIPAMRIHSFLVVWFVRQCRRPPYLKFVLLSCLNERLFCCFCLVKISILKNYVGDLLLANWFFDNY